MDYMSLAARHNSSIGVPWAGAVAEFYYGLGTPLGQGAYGQSSAAPQIIKQLAHRGPFVIPNMANSLLEYRSFWKGNRVYDGDTDLIRGSNALWTSGGTLPTMVPHPMLSPLYRRPDKARRMIGI
jgi:hypothetical protein